MKLIEFINEIDLEKLKSVEFDSYSATCDETKFYRINKDTFPLIIKFIHYLRNINCSVPPKRTLIIDKENYVEIVKVYEGGRKKIFIDSIELPYTEILGMELSLNYHDLDDFEDQVKYLDKLAEMLTYDFLIYSEDDRLDYIRAKKIEKTLQEKQTEFETSTRMKIKIKGKKLLINLGIGNFLLGIVLLVSNKYIKTYISIEWLISGIIPGINLILLLYGLKEVKDINKLFKNNIKVITEDYIWENPNDAGLFDKNYIKIHSNTIL